MKKIFTFAFTFILLISCKAQQEMNTQNSSNSNSENPKLIVGIVVDQMRYDYLPRFYDKYGEGGFKRIINDGFNLKNAHFNYTTTKTGVGHTSIYTGTTQSVHGIMANDYFHKYENKMVNCVEDNRQETVGSSTKKGKKSPHRIEVSTIGDQLKLSQNMRGKTIGISIKDRGAILPAGHSANAAYWYDGGNVGKFITSTYYMNSLPSWVNSFNNSGVVDKYLSKPWNTYYDITTYTESIEDNNNYEQLFKGEKTPTFPHDLPKLRAKNDNFSLVKETPFGNSLVADFAIEAIKNEKLGQTNYTDMLTISFSSTDYVGHSYGVSAKETQDTYIRLDKDIERLLNTLDAQVGKGNYTLFLTSDHGATEVPRYLKDNNIPANYVDIKEFRKYVKGVSKSLFNADDIIKNLSNNNIFLNKEKLKSLNLDPNTVAQQIADELINHPLVYRSVTARTLQTTDFTDKLMSLVQNSFNQKYSGDIVFMFKPSTISTYYEKGGTTHGTGYNYNTHIPILFYGNGIKKGESYKYYSITDIAPTISALYEFQFPNGTTGDIIEEVIE